MNANATQSAIIGDGDDFNWTFEVSDDSVPFQSVFSNDPQSETEHHVSSEHEVDSDAETVVLEEDDREDGGEYKDSGDHKVLLCDFDFNNYIAELKVDNYVALCNTLEDFNTDGSFTKESVFAFLNSYKRTEEFENTLDYFIDELAMNSGRHNLIVILFEYCKERLGYDINYDRILHFRNTCDNVKLALREKIDLEIALEREKIKNMFTSVSHSMSHINGIKNLISNYVL
jgi:hypothetical protein